MGRQRQQANDKNKSMRAWAGWGGVCVRQKTRELCLKSHPDSYTYTDCRVQSTAEYYLVPIVNHYSKPTILIPPNIPPTHPPACSLPPPSDVPPPMCALRCAMCLHTYLLCLGEMYIRMPMNMRVLRLLGLGKYSTGVFYLFRSVLLLRLLPAAAARRKQARSPRRPPLPTLVDRAKRETPPPAAPAAPAAPTAPPPGVPGKGPPPGRPSGETPLTAKVRGRVALHARHGGWGDHDLRHPPPRPRPPHGGNIGGRAASHGTSHGARGEGGAESDVVIRRSSGGGGRGPGIGGGVAAVEVAEELHFPPLVGTEDAIHKWYLFS
jgi:hypothetical protein